MNAEDGGSRFLLNICASLQVYMMSLPEASIFSPSDPQMSHSDSLLLVRIQSK